MNSRKSLVTKFYSEDMLDELYKQLCIGDRLEFKRSWKFSLWAIYIGDDKIIHRGINHSSSGIMENTIKEVIKSTPIRKNNELDALCNPLQPQEIVERARNKMKIDKTNYNIMSNNSEHFATECRYDKQVRQQFEDMQIRFYPYRHWVIPVFISILSIFLLLITPENENIQWILNIVPYLLMHLIVVILLCIFAVFVSWFSAEIYHLIRNFLNPLSYIDSKTQCEFLDKKIEEFKQNPITTSFLENIEQLKKEEKEIENNLHILQENLTKTLKENNNYVREFNSINQKKFLLRLFYYKSIKELKQAIEELLNKEREITNKMQNEKKNLTRIKNELQDLQGKHEKEKKLKIETVNSF